MVKKVNFDDFSENYNQLLKESTGFFTADESYFAAHKVALLKKQMIRYNMRHSDMVVKRVLEFGCGIGRNIPALQWLFPEAEVVGTDISTVSLQRAIRENPGAKFISEVDYDEGTPKFDLIFIAGVFHHIPLEARLAVAQKIYHRLRPSGLLFVSEHNPYNPVTRQIVKQCAFDEDAELLKRGALLSILGQAGFEPENSAYYLFVPPKLIFLRWLEATLEWLPLGGQYWVLLKRPI
jgi:SAM-dependent methyltransferase